MDEDTQPTFFDAAAPSATPALTLPFDSTDVSWLQQTPSGDGNFIAALQRSSTGTLYEVLRRTEGLPGQVTRHKAIRKRLRQLQS